MKAPSQCQPNLDSVGMSGSTVTGTFSCPVTQQYGVFMELGQKQEIFMRLLPRLIDKAHQLGFEIRGGDLFRDPRVHGQHGVSILNYVKKIFGYTGNRFGYGYRKSCHKLKLAIDLNLMKDRKLVTTTEGHRELGEWWENAHPDCRWGGRFNDGNHYSMEHDGSM